MKTPIEHEQAGRVPGGPRPPGQPPRPLAGGSRAAFAPPAAAEPGAEPEEAAAPVEDGAVTQAAAPPARSAPDGAAGPRAPAVAAGEPRRAKALTIGAVVKQLEREFPDISISKIRYLEDQKLLTPRRTQGGYRLYGARDVQRLRTILRLQRDEFLPLRVIRQELAAGRADEDDGGGQAEGGGGPEARTKTRRRNVTVAGGGERFPLQSVLEDTGADPGLVRELEDFGVIKGERVDGEVLYDDTEREIVRAATELARFGVGGRNLRAFRSSADRESSLLEQILAPSLRSRNPERRREAVEALENLAAVVSRLKYLLLVRDLRRIAP